MALVIQPAWPGRLIIVVKHRRPVSSSSRPAPRPGPLPPARGPALALQGVCQPLYALIQMQTCWAIQAPVIGPARAAGLTDATLLQTTYHNLATASRCSAHNLRQTRHGFGLVITSVPWLLRPHGSGEQSLWASV